MGYFLPKVNRTQQMYHQRTTRVNDANYAVEPSYKVVLSRINANTRPIKLKQYDVYKKRKEARERQNEREEREEKSDGLKSMNGKGERINVRI